MTLSDVAHGRNNNFNLLRMLAAISVLVSHSFVLATGNSSAQPLSSFIALGGIAVDVFFVTSGFLITASILRRPNLAEFVWARCVRIYPALIVVVFATCFVLGPALTNLPLGTYFKDVHVYQYFARCSTMLFGYETRLPGVFVSNPYPAAVNGSLWSMPYEVRMYAILACLWLASSVFRANRLRIFHAALIACAGVSLIAVVYFGAFEVARWQFGHLFFMFYGGAALYVLRRHIPVSAPLAVVVAVLLIASTLLGRAVFGNVYLFAIGYLVIYAAYAPSKWLQMYNRLGDYSYGTYILAFPIQQTIIWALPGISPFGVIAMAAPITVSLAVLSWNCVERHALKLKSTPPFGLRVLVRPTELAESR